MFTEITRLQESVDQRLGLAGMVRNGKRLTEAQINMGLFATLKFDEDNFPNLLAEHKKLAGGEGVSADVTVPAVHQRTVIREAMYALKGLEFVDANTEAFTSSIAIPYSYRDTSAAGRANTRVYEGQEIHRAGVLQTSELAFPIPQKLSFGFSDELRYLTSARHLNWDAEIENLKNTTRIIAEDTDQLILNEMLHASDEYAAVAVANENLELQANDANTVLLLAHFPVVRPRRVFDLQGTQVGTTANPVTVAYNSTARDEYDGTGTQASGIYYVLDYDIGELRLVAEDGATLVPADGVTYTISYSYATNVYKFDMDEGSAEAGVHWDTFLFRYAQLKTDIEENRYHRAEFGLMSGTVQTTIAQAKTFAANFLKPGTDLTSTGDLGRIKGVPNFKTYGPGLWYGDRRVLIGERGITRYRLLKPWQPSTFTSERGPNGRYTGRKDAYGDQWIVVHTPTQLKRAYTSMVLYSSSQRVARVNP